MSFYSHQLPPRIPHRSPTSPAAEHICASQVLLALVLKSATLLDQYPYCLFHVCVQVLVLIPPQQSIESHHQSVPTVLTPLGPTPSTIPRTHDNHGPETLRINLLCLVLSFISSASLWVLFSSHRSFGPLSHFCCLVTKLCSTLLQPRGQQPARFFCPWDFPSKNTVVGCHFLLQGIFLTQGSNPCLLQWQAHSLLLIPYVIHLYIKVFYDFFESDYSNCNLP